MAKKEASELLSIEGREVRVSHPGKLYFSREILFSKLDLVLTPYGRAPAESATIRSFSGAISTEFGGRGVIARPARTIKGLN